MATPLSENWARMKILYLSRAVLPSEISNSLSIMRMSQAFTDGGHDVILTGVASQKNLTDPVEYFGLKGGFKVVRNQIGSLFNNPVGRRLFLPGLVLAWKTRRLFTEFRPDIIYSRLTLLELAHVPAGTPIVYEMHSLGQLGKSFVEKNLFLWLLKKKNFRRIVATTDALAELLRNRLPEVDVVVARLSADFPVPVTPIEIRDFRDSHLKGSGFERHAGYTGYLDTVGLRGTDVICRTAALMPKVAFHIVGGEPEIVEHWRQYSRNYNKHGNIFFYGYRKSSEIPCFLSCFDVVLAPLQYIPKKRAPTGSGMSPLKIPQYMSYRKPIVASDIPAHREILENGRTARLVKHDEPEQWAGAIQELLLYPERARSMGEAAGEAYEAGFTPSIRVKNILAGL